MHSKIDRTAVRKIDTEETESDFAFWQSRPYHERLSTLESIRREYHAWRYGGTRISESLSHG